jgi:Xaa-Pro aminopeptidase
MGPRGESRRLDGKDKVNRGVGELFTTNAFTSIVYTDDYQGEIVARELKRRGYRTIGTLAAGHMPYAFMRRIENELAGQAKFVDASDFVDRIKAIKSPEEIGLVRQAALMQDEIFSRVLRQVKPGMRDAEITALTQYEGRLLGSEQGLFLANSAPLGQRAGFADRNVQGRTLRAGEHFSLLIENSGPGGFYCEIGRTVVLGKASNELTDGFEAMKEAQTATLALMKPGASCNAIADAHDAFMRERGLSAELRLYCHGQGYDLVERPLVRADETMVIEKDMNFAVHPGYATNSIFAVICDNYLIGDQGPGACLHQTPKQIFELN